MWSNSLTKAALVFVTLSAVGGCAPAVTHGPRIEPGFSGGFSASLSAGPRYENGDDGPTIFLFGPVGVNAGYGWSSPRAGGAGLRLGVHVPVPAVTLVQPDVYVQFPRDLLAGLDAGVGVSALGTVWGRVRMPYVQLGHISERGSGWYTTQGYYRNDRNVEVPVRPVYRSEAWIPAIGYQRGGARTTSHLYLMGMTGRVFYRCDASGDAICRIEPRWSVAAGVIVERHRLRPQRP